MKIDESHLHARVKARQQFIHLAKRAIRRRHMDPSLDVHHGASDPTAAPRDVKALARQFGRIVGRPQQTGLAHQIIVDLTLIPDMITGGNHVYPHPKQLLANIGRNPKTTRRVLPVGDHQIHPLLSDNPLAMLSHD